MENKIISFVQKLDGERKKKRECKDHPEVMPIAKLDYFINFLAL
jgi:hypothetical protein